MDFKKIKSILVVCTGNSCRSVMAEGFLKKMLNDRKDISVSSCGISAVNGITPTQETVDVMKESDIDVSGHRSCYLTDEIVKNTDLILAMTGTHKDSILSRLPDAKDKIYLLGSFDDKEKEQNIADPIGMPIDFYKSTRDSIKKSLEQFIKLL